MKNLQISSLSSGELKSSLTSYNFHSPMLAAVLALKIYLFSCQIVQHRVASELSLKRLVLLFFIVIHIIHSRRAIQMIPARILRIFIRARALRFSHVIVLVCSSCPIGGSHAKAVQCLKLWARLIVLLGQLLCCLVERRWKRYDWKFISCRVKSQPAAKVEFSRSIWTNTYICVARSDEAKWKIDFSACQRYRWHRQWIRKHADKPEKCLRREHQAKSVGEWNMINTLFWKVDKHFFISSPH